MASRRVVNKTAEPAQPAQAVASEQVQPVQNGESAMADNVVVESEASAEQSADTQVLETQGEPLDILSDTCPTELRTWYTDEQRARLRQLFMDGAIARTVNRIEISGDKNPTGVAQQQPYFAYAPVLVNVSENPDVVLVDMTAAYLLSHSKLGIHTDWKSLGQEAKTDAQVEQKNSDETWGVTSHYVHGLDLKVRQDVRAILSGVLMGPIGEIAKGVKNVFLNKVEPTKQAAFDLVVSRRKANGMPVPDGLTLVGLGIKWPKGSE